MPSLGANTIAILIALGSFPVSLALTRFFMYWNSAHGITGIDVHKLNRPKVPEMVGVAVPVTLILFAAIYAMIGGVSSIPLLAYSLVVGLAALVGAVDDRLKLRGIFKPVSTLLCGLPLLLLGVVFPGQIYTSTLHVPLFGGYHLPVIYPLTVLVAVSVTSNTVNMLDPLNGYIDCGGRPAHRIPTHRSGFHSYLSLCQLDVLAVRISVLQPFSGTSICGKCRSIINWRICGGAGDLGEN